ncbi:hypothetical protein BKA93DRAFT_748184 [Sparassis latifolia]
MAPDNPKQTSSVVKCLVGRPKGSKNKPDAGKNDNPVGRPKKCTVNVSPAPAPRRVVEMSEADAGSISRLEAGPLDGSETVLTLHMEQSNWVIGESDDVGRSQCILPQVREGVNEEPSVNDLLGYSNSAVEDLDEDLHPLPDDKEDSPSPSDPALQQQLGGHKCGPPRSSIPVWLTTEYKNMCDQLQAKMGRNASRNPSCYDLKAPIFGMSHQFQLKPSAFYKPRFFVWLPHLFQKIPCPACSTVGRTGAGGRMRSIGPKPFQEMIKTFHFHHYEKLYFQYLEMVKIHANSSFANLLLSHDCFSIPSAQYFGGLYDLLIEKHSPEIDQFTAMLSARILCVDHSHKVPKHLGKVESEAVFGALHSVVNEYGECRAMTLTPMKAHDQFMPTLMSAHPTQTPKPH